MNGQPALLSVGENVTYISSIEVDRDTGGVQTLLTYTVETERVLSGVSLALTANILNDKEVIMNLVPITSSSRRTDRIPRHRSGRPADWLAKSQGPRDEYHCAG